MSQDVTQVHLTGELVIGQGNECTENLQQIHAYFPKVEILIVVSNSEGLCWPILTSLSRMENLRDVTLHMPTADIYSPLPEQHIPILTKLNLYHHLQYYTPLIIPNARHLEILSLNNFHFSGDGLTSLLHVLQHPTKLQQLILQDSTIEDPH